MGASFVLIELLLTKKYICLYVYDTLQTTQDLLNSKRYFTVLHFVGSFKIFGRFDCCYLLWVITVFWYGPTITYTSFDLFRKCHLLSKDKRLILMMKSSLSFHIQLFICVRTLTILGLSSPLILKVQGLFGLLSSSLVYFSFCIPASRFMANRPVRFIKLKLFLQG